ncbi:MAG: ArsA family ATPase [Candidatus Heimdallarchaeota archaeon]|nr:ArsA family ATPase [Candidatus Heimdallarchaeota archaeon]
MTIQNLLQNKERRFVLVGGKGGVGKSSISSSIAVKFAQNGQPTLIISTDPAHSLSDSFDQNLNQSIPVKINNIDNLWAMEIRPEDAGGDFKSLAGLDDNEEGIDQMMSSLSSLGFDEVGDLLDTAPPGIDEAVALAKVIQFIDSDEYAHFERIIFDTAPTGHTLRLLSLPDFLDGFLGKLLKVRVKMSNAMAGFKSLLGMNSERDNTLEVLENLKESMRIVRELFRNQQTTEFIIATIPTIMSINESERLADQLRIEEIQVHNIVVNQVMPENIDCKFCSVRAKGQKENLDYIKKLFSNYHITEVEYFDTEIRGLDSLKMMATHLLGN